MNIEGSVLPKNFNIDEITHIIVMRVQETRRYIINFTYEEYSFDVYPEELMKDTHSEISEEVVNNKRIKLTMNSGSLKGLGERFIQEIKNDHGYFQNPEVVRFLRWADKYGGYELSDEVKKRIEKPYDPIGRFLTRIGNVIERSVDNIVDRFC